MPEEHEGAQALKEIEALLLEEEVRGIPELKDICAQYRKIKPKVDKALDFVEFIPIYGAQVALTIRFLAKVAEFGCSYLDAKAS